MYIPKAMKETSSKLLDTFVDFNFEIVDQPLLPSQSNFAPVEEIGEAVIVTEIEGKILDDFPEGVYIRNGSNPLFGGLKSSKSIFGKSSHLWIEGEGMLHALYITKERGKRSKWNMLYKNKYVETDTVNMEKNRKKLGFLPNMEGDALVVLMATFLNLVLKKDKNINQLTNNLQECMKELGIVKGILPKVFQERDFKWEEVKSYNEMNMLLNYEISMLKKKVDTLDEDILMKEGQITILKDSIGKPFDLLASPDSLL
ncbi:hypothetical protein CQW23_31946 [Capsicum baccatum]|uniref:Carotenoid 9,10(9',10')-cleavage dioxygenase 1 n=1 Tax=Capsicum baccatum TaxID=33114 RepID=A0A2G2V627_CAPBA|nr:hypothetical protein CQW23_31946 [Capsicum baccatum]